MFDFKKAEKDVLEFWEKNKIYQKVKARNLNGKKFYYHLRGKGVAKNIKDSRNQKDTVRGLKRFQDYL